MSAGADQVVPLNVIAWPEKSTATQNELVAQETELVRPDESMGMGGDQVELLYDHPCPPPPSAMQADVDVHETEVRWLDPGDGFDPEDCVDPEDWLEPGEPSSALAVVGIVNVQAESSPAMSRTPASERDSGRYPLSN